MTDILIALIGAASIVAPAILLHLREIKKKEEEFLKYKKTKELEGSSLDKFLELTTFNEIKNGVDELFEKTKADRFLILFAINGKNSFRTVSVVFEAQKKSIYSINAVGRYKSLTIDNPYREMLKNAEINGIIELDVEKMPEGLLKNIYAFEEVKWSDIRHLVRIHKDAENDLLVFSSLATHEDKGFTKLEKAKASAIYESVIKPNIIKVLDN